MPSTSAGHAGEFGACTLIAAPATSPPRSAAISSASASMSAKVRATDPSGTHTAGAFGFSDRVACQRSRIVFFTLLSARIEALFAVPLFDMKADTHPNYTETVIVCACGATYRTRSTRDNLKIGICAACHPFFTGEQKFVDTAGRVEKFARRYGSTKATRATKK